MGNVARIEMNLHDAQGHIQRLDNNFAKVVKNPYDKTIITENERNK